MLAILVQIHVKSESVDAFIQATLENARNSAREPGITRFEFYRQQDDPNRFVLMEIYREAEDQQRHRETSHYLAWRDAVAEMMVEPRLGIKYDDLTPTG